LVLNAIRQLDALRCRGLFRVVGWHPPLSHYRSDLLPDAELRDDVGRLQQLLNVRMRLGLDIPVAIEAILP
jgi:hypothetical protein